MGEVKQMLGGGRRSKPQEEVVRPKEAMPKPTIPISGYALEEWNRVGPELYLQNRLTIIDASLFTSYCLAYAHYRTAEEELDLLEKGKDPDYQPGFGQKTKNGNFIQHPLYGTVNSARTEMLRIAKEFGLTPSARATIDDLQKADDDPRAHKYF